VHACWITVVAAAAEVVSQFSSDSVGACQVSFHLMRALTSVVNLLYEPRRCLTPSSTVTLM
jgi:hypothetical protein